MAPFLLTNRLAKMLTEIEFFVNLKSRKAKKSKINISGRRTQRMEVFIFLLDVHSFSSFRYIGFSICFCPFSFEMKGFVIKNKFNPIFHNPKKLLSILTKSKLYFISITLGQCLKTPQIRL